METVSKKEYCICWQFFKIFMIIEIEKCQQVWKEQTYFPNEIS